MPFVFEYLLKLSVSLSLVYLFYQLVLRRLTFYNWNRWYLLIYSGACFFFPFIDIAPVLQQNNLSDSQVILWVPVISGTQEGSGLASAGAAGLEWWSLVSLVILAGMTLLFARLVIQLWSFRRMMRKARLIFSEGTKLYQVEDNIIPFSFGNSIFINRDLHSPQELREIISHEFVHVRQRHSIDIIWGEMICLLNWFNPFAWLIRKAIRQNLEFIADNKVLDYGVDRREYQYLLLKVIGNKQFSIAQQFNFSSLKKRIAMMNKMKSAGVHVLKFLFILPLVAVLLLAFRNQQENSGNKPGDQQRSAITRDQLQHSVFTDTVLPITKPNSKGYVINVKGVQGTCVVEVKDKNGKEVDRVLLTDWNEDQSKYYEKYGEIIPPPPPPPPAKAAVDPVDAVEATPATVPVEGMAPLPVRAGAACDPNPAVVTPVAVGTSDYEKLNRVGVEWEITEDKAWVKLKDGKKEDYDLSNPSQKAAFESRYGRIIRTSKGYSPTPVAFVGSGSGVTAYTPAPSGMAIVNIDDRGHIITGKEDAMVVISKNATREELEIVKKEMKAKGVDLDFDEIEYMGDKIVKLSGTMKSGESQSNFVAVDFEQVVLAMIKKDGRTYLKVVTREGKTVI